MPKRRISGAHIQYLHTFTTCAGLNVPLRVTELGWLKTDSYIMTLTLCRVVLLEVKGLLKKIRQLIIFIALEAVNYYSNKAFADSCTIQIFQY